MKKAMLLLAVLGSVFFAGCAKEDEAQTETTTQNADGTETETKVETEVTTSAQ